MVSKSHAKRRQDIKTKLMAAIAMLLVSSIMMVSSTYAWFTLSTAPEVTGITTAVGANGNLEMMLQPLNGASEEVNSSTGDSLLAQDIYLANTTWGNLVDLSNNTYYGLDKITLNPSKLNTLEDTAGLKIAAAPLSTPKYGADGRVAELVNETFTGVYDKDGTKTFVEGVTVGEVTGNNGVRAIGVSSGMTDRELAYRAAVQEASSAAGLAKSTAAQSLNAKGARLADIAIKHATAEADETYTKADLEVLHSMTVDLLGDGTDANIGSVGYIKNALIKYALATELTTAADNSYSEIVTAYETITLEALNTRTTNAAVKTAIAKLEETIADVTTAKGLLETQIARTDVPAEGYAWNDFSTALTYLANPSAMQVNGIAVSELTGNWKATAGEVLPNGYTTDGEGYVLDGDGKRVSNMSRLVDAVLGDGLQLIIASGAGVYADIADHCGDYSARVTLSKISYGGMTVGNLDATMSTKTSVNPQYLADAKEKVGTYQTGSSTAASKSINDFYGYIIDLAFRTNAAGSKLMLQQEAVDRINETNEKNEDTMGGGAYMSFRIASNNFGDDAAKELMGSIRLVFFETDTTVIKGYARLDTNNPQIQADGSIKMALQMCDANGAPKTEQSIVELEQNQVYELSVMVYLDGETVTNADVAYDQAKSLDGKLNLQFSSSAELVPMNYTDLIDGDSNDVVDYGKGENGTETPATPTPVDVEVDSITDGYTATLVKYVEGVGVVAVINGTDGAVTTGTVTIGGTPATYTTVPGVGSAWVAAASSAPASVAITVAV